LRICLKEEIFIKLNKIKKNHAKEWKKLPLSIKKNRMLELSVNYTYNTNAIEGSTITLDETEDLIVRHISPNKPLEDVKETINHSKTFLEIMNSKQKMNIKTILQWHASVFSESKPDIAGRFRDYLVRVGNYRAPDWQDVKSLMKDFIDWYNKNKKTMHPIELAARAHYKFEMIHPFGDGNGRVGRLIIAQILRINNYPMLIIQYKNRKSYYRAIEKEENDFVSYFIKRYISAYKEYL